MFAMFFGAGNVVFPLIIGKSAQGSVFYAVIGLMLSAVCVPFTGLIAMILFNGNYSAFFRRIGALPGFLMTALIIALIGPFGAIPRCISLSYSTMTMFLSDIPIEPFSAFSCLLILLFTMRPSSILDMIGKVLTPLLLATLLVIIVKGIVSAPTMPPTTIDSVNALSFGLIQGYQTMDLLGAFFFSAVVISCLQENLHPNRKQDYRHLTTLTLKASAIGAFLIAVIYVGFAYVAAYNSTSLEAVNSDLLLGTLALHVLGPYAGIITSIAVALACLTTAIALASVFAEFLQRDIMRNSIGYLPALIVTLITTYFISTLEFRGIIELLAPILAVCYPALIVLSLLNISCKLYNYQPIKAPFYITFAFSLYFEHLT